jgi:hypothetical protein
MVVAVATESYSSVGFFSNLIDELDASVPIEPFWWRHFFVYGVYWAKPNASVALSAGIKVF